MFALVILIVGALGIAGGVPPYVVIPPVLISLLLFGAMGMFAGILDYRERREWNRLAFLREYEAAIRLRDAARQPANPPYSEFECYRDADGYLDIESMPPCDAHAFYAQFGGYDEQEAQQAGERA